VECGGQGSQWIRVSLTASGAVQHVSCAISPPELIQNYAVSMAIGNDLSHFVVCRAETWLPLAYGIKVGECIHQHIFRRPTVVFAPFGVESETIRPTTDIYNDNETQQ
jgi:hypothetical protein